ncbi:MAG TPA: efflux RND transporter permease subunit [Trichormus sp.]
MLADFFIKRPIFATVCSLIIVLAGAISIPNLPVAQYPNITPPQVMVTSTYIGANAQAVESSVTVPLEQQINGVQGMKYMSSTSGNDGTSTITVTFDLERDIDNAAVEVQNRVATAQGRLPAEVRATGITVQKGSSGFIMGIGVGSKHGEYTNLFLSNYVDRYVKDSLKRVKGVADVQIFGERKYAMRLWLDPNKLAARKLTPMDVTKALSEQNVQVAAGQIGQQPAPADLAFQMSVRAVGRLKDPKEFDQIVVRNDPNSLVKIRDIGHAELGAEDYGSVLRFNGVEAVGLGITSLPDANAIDVANGVRKEMENLSEYFPPGMQYMVAFDATNSVNESIKEVTHTLAQAIFLVVLVIFLFLQNWRSTIIPAITIPVSLIGTFAFMKAFGFSINTLTLFGITLATGLVVDDAIVVVENIYRTMREKRMDAVEASAYAMREVTGAVVATSLVLAAVFIPVAFFPGTTGQLYKQFALTISFSVGISAFNALTLTPALSALWLNSRQHEARTGLFGKINKFLDWLKAGYGRSLSLSLRMKPVILTVFVAGLAATYWLFQTIPSAFIPNEDQGYFFIIIQGPDGVSLDYTNKVVNQVEKVLFQFPEITGTFAVSGFSFTGNSPSSGFVAGTLKTWKDRPKADQTLDKIIERVRPKLAQITGANVFAFNPPAIQGLGAFGGFFYELQDRRGQDVKTLANAANTVVGAANARKELSAVNTPFKANSPQLLIQVDRDKAKNLDIDVSNIFSTLQILLGSEYVNDFDMDSRVYRVYVQADKEFRANPKDIEQFYVRSNRGAMVPLGNLVHIQRLVSPPIISHYNMFRSVEINGANAPGFSSGQAMDVMKQLSKELLPKGFAYEWSGISRESLESEGKAGLIFGLGIIFVFLVLAAQYESFVDPLIILLAVPIAILGALIAQTWRGLDNDVFCQIGLVMLIGLASKNAILIVEFANQLRTRGMDSEQAVIEAAKIRLRPILMTSIAFILGILPLILAEGAGANSRRSLGTAVFGGMLVSTVLNLYIVPSLYVLIKRLREGKTRPPRGRHVQVPDSYTTDGHDTAIDKEDLEPCHRGGGTC